jgi:hypothetical protein
MGDGRFCLGGGRDLFSKERSQKLCLLAHVQAEEYGFLGCKAVYLEEAACFLLGLLLDLEDGGEFPQNVGLSTNYTALQLSTTLFMLTAVRTFHHQQLTVFLLFSSDVLPKFQAVGKQGKRPRHTRTYGYTKYLRRELTKPFLHTRHLPSQTGQQQ